MSKGDKRTDGGPVSALAFMRRLFRIPTPAQRRERRILRECGCICYCSDAPHVYIFAGGR